MRVSSARCATEHRFAHVIRSGFVRAAANVRAKDGCRSRGGDAQAAPTTACCLNGGPGRQGGEGLRLAAPVRQTRAPGEPSRLTPTCRAVGLILGRQAARTDAGLSGNWVD